MKKVYLFLILSLSQFSSFSCGSQNWEADVYKVLLEVEFPCIARFDSAVVVDHTQDPIWDVGYFTLLDTFAAIPGYEVGDQIVVSGFRGNSCTENFADWVANDTLVLALDYSSVTELYAEFSFQYVAGMTRKILEGNQEYEDARIRALSVINTVSSRISEEELSVYPNPISDEFFILGVYEGVKMFSLEGRLIKEFGEESLNIEEVPSGFYLLEFSNGNRIIRKKIVKE